jgi:hypothetical protein
VVFLLGRCKEAGIVMAAMKRNRQRKPRIVTQLGETIVDNHAEGEVIRLELSRAYRDKQEREVIRRALSRRQTPEDSEAMRFAMRAVEHRIVKGLWVLEISLPGDGPRPSAKHGIDYMREREDHFAAGEWQHGPARPAVPSNREIEAAKEAVKWLEALPEQLARLVRVAAQTKRGDRENRVNWIRVQERLPEQRGREFRTLLDRYHRALRMIVAELTIKRIGK